MSVDPASWQPGTKIVDRGGVVMVADARRDNGWLVLHEGCPAWVSNELLAESWHPLADVVARGWERQEVPVRWCPYHECIASDPGEDRCDDAARAHLAPACPLTPALSYPITEGNEP